MHGPGSLQAPRAPPLGSAVPALSVLIFAETVSGLSSRAPPLYRRGSCVSETLSCVLKATQEGRRGAKPGRLMPKPILDHEAVPAPGGHC